MSPVLLWFSFWASLVAGVVRSQFPAQSLFPASIPLATRSPYLNAWLNSANNSQPISRSWPAFCGLQLYLGWSARIRVDGTSYDLMNLASGPNTGVKANVTNVQITPARSIFILQAGPMSVTITFLSPIEPSDWVLQSLPFSYFSLEASSLDGQDHRIQVYSDIDGSWLSGNAGSPVKWSHNTSSGGIFHEIRLLSPREGVESLGQQAQDGVAYYAMADMPGTTWQISSSADTWATWHSQGNLWNNASMAFGTIDPVLLSFAFALDLGTIESTAEPVTWAIGYVRDPSIMYTAPDATMQRLRPYFTTKYGTNIGAAIDDFLSGYNVALQRSIAFDQAVSSNASAVSSQYVDLVSLTARQTLSTLDITVSTGSDGQPNASDVRIFMKNIGESGEITGRVNPVENIYAALPALLYFNPSLVGPLLAPLLDAQDNATANLPYAVQDIGVAYPNATGPHGPHGQGVEQSGNMLILMHAHARFSGDGLLLRKHYNLAKRWADYLVGSALTPVHQSSADNEGIANQTNLAIKGIIAVKAMAQISNTLGEDSDAHRYDSQAAMLYDQWQSLALSSDAQHLLGVYNDEASWALMYNLYADSLLGTNIMNQTLLENQTAFYKNLLGFGPTFGLKLDNTAQETSMAWLLFTAAVVLDDDVRDGLVHGAWARASSNVTAGPFPNHYDVQTGQFLDGVAGPAAGGVFSLLALNLPSKEILTTPGQSQPPNPSASTSATAPNSRAPAVGAIAGGIAGGVALVALVAACGLLYVRKRRRSKIPPPELHRRLPSSLHTFLSHSQNSALASYCDNSPGGLPPLQAHTIDLFDLNSPTPGARNTRPLQPQSARTHETALAQLAWAESAFVPSDARSDSVGPLSTRVGLSSSLRLASQEGLASSQGPPSQEAPPPGQVPLPSREVQKEDSGSRSATPGPVEHIPAHLLGLRAEMENLRRTVLEMQERQEERMTPPPSYYTG